MCLHVHMSQQIEAPKIEETQTKQASPAKASQTASKPAKARCGMRMLRHMMSLGTNCMQDVGNPTQSCCATQ